MYYILAYCIQYYIFFSDLGIPAEEWNGSSTCISSGIVFVSVENAVTDEFKEYLLRQVLAKKLARIVIDEAHLIDMWSTFRDAYNRLRYLKSSDRPVNCQLIFLTATAPAQTVENIYKMLYNENQYLKPLVIRSNTNRTNISYIIKNVESENDVDDVLFDTIRLWRESEDNSSKCIIYTHTVDQAKTLATKLNVKYYIGELTRDQKKSLLEEFLSNDGYILVATTAFGVGIDSDVSLVINREIPHSVLNYSQESGRGGRTGNHSKSILISSNQFNKNLKKNHETRSEIIKMIDLVETTRCIRQVGIFYDCYSEVALQFTFLIFLSYF